MFIIFAGQKSCKRFRAENDLPSFTSRNLHRPVAWEKLAKVKPVQRGRTDFDSQVPVSETPANVSLARTA